MYCKTGPAIGTGPAHTHAVNCVPPHTHGPPISIGRFVDTGAGGAVIIAGVLLVGFWALRSVLKQPA